MPERNDPFDLQRFIDAQEDENTYRDALAELESEKKRSHWMWFIFPQFKGLGQSSMSIKYSIKSLEEAKAFLRHPVLGARLRECAAALLAIDGKTASEVFGYPDDLKLKSSMTLFEQAAGEEDSIFSAVLGKYFGGEKDTRTLELLNS